MRVEYTDSRKNPCMAVNVIDPAATTDYTANTQADGLGVNKTTEMTVTVISKDAKGMDMEIKNTGAAGWYVTLLKVRGDPAVLDDQAESVAEDEQSILTRGRITLSNLGGGDLMDDALDSQEFATYILQNAKDPHELVGVTVRNGSQLDLLQIMGRQPTDRIAVSIATQGINSTYCIGAVAHRINAESKEHHVTWTLEEPLDQGIWVLGGEGVGSRFSYETLVGV